MTKRKPKQYRDERGRFVSLPPEAQAKLDAMRESQRPRDIDVTTVGSVAKQYVSPYCDEIYRPKKIGWLERIIRFWMWRHA